MDGDCRENEDIIGGCIAGLVVGLRDDSIIVEAGGEGEATKLGVFDQAESRRCVPRNTDVDCLIGLHPDDDVGRSLHIDEPLEAARNLPEHAEGVRVAERYEAVRDHVISLEIEAGAVRIYAPRPWAWG
jgi:hypothetical protein